MLRLTALLIAFVLPTVGWADRLPSHYPQEVMMEGSVDALDFSSLTVNIGDTLFYLSADTRVATPTRREASRSDIRLGGRAGCNYRIDGNRRYVLTEVWILPRGMSFED